MLNNMSDNKLTFSAGKAKYTLMQTVDSDETAHNEPFHQDLHYLPFLSRFLTDYLFTTTDMSSQINV